MFAFSLFNCSLARSHVPLIFRTIPAAFTSWNTCLHGLHDTLKVFICAWPRAFILNRYLEQPTAQHEHFPRKIVEARTLTRLQAPSKRIKSYTPTGVKKGPGSSLKVCACAQNLTLTPALALTVTLALYKSSTRAMSTPNSGSAASPRVFSAIFEIVEISLPRWCLLCAHDNGDYFAPTIVITKNKNTTYCCIILHTNYLVECYLFPVEHGGVRPPAEPTTGAMGPNATNTMLERVKVVVGRWRAMLFLPAG